MHRYALRGVLQQEKVLPDVPDQEAAGPSPTARGLLSAFLNIPYDDTFQSLYLAYIAGITAFGLAPRATNLALQLSNKAPEVAEPRRQRLELAKVEGVRAIGERA